MEILNKYAAGLPNLMRWIRAAFASGEKPAMRAALGKTPEQRKAVAEFLAQKPGGRK
jgi:hypothetical protein